MFPSKNLSALEKSENFNAVNQVFAAAAQSLVSSLYYSRCCSAFCTRHVHLSNETLLFSVFSWEVQRGFPNYVINEDIPHQKRKLAILKVKTTFLV